MAEIELIPTLTRCVQSTARREFSRILDQCLENEEEDQELGAKLELLRLFLESADFGELRRHSEAHLTAGRSVKFTLRLESGEPRYEITVES